jgi:hypothetical protein
MWWTRKYFEYATCRQFSLITSYCSNSKVNNQGVCWSIVGLGTMLQTGRWRVCFPMRYLNFSIDEFVPALLWPCVDLACNKMSIRNVLGRKGRPACKTNNLTAICELIVCKMLEPRPYWSPRPVTGLTLLYFNIRPHSITTNTKIVETDRFGSDVRL